MDDAVARWTGAAALAVREHGDAGAQDERGGPGIVDNFARRTAYIRADALEVDPGLPLVRVK